MITNKTLRMTNQEKFVFYYQESLPNSDKNETAFKLAVKKWHTIHKCDPPYSSYNSFKVAYSTYLRNS